MKKLKKLLFVLTIGIISFCLASCGSNDNDVNLINPETKSYKIKYEVSTNNATKYMLRILYVDANAKVQTIYTNSPFTLSFKQTGLIQYYYISVMAIAKSEYETGHQIPQTTYESSLTTTVNIYVDGKLTESNTGNGIAAANLAQYTE